MSIDRYICGYISISLLFHLLDYCILYFKIRMKIIIIQRDYS